MPRTDKRRVKTICRGLLILIFFLPQFLLASGSQGRSPTHRLFEACLRQGHLRQLPGTAGPRELTEGAAPSASCVDCTPSSLSSRNGLQSLQAVSSQGLIDQEVSRCRGEHERLGCDELKRDVENDPAALGKLRECTPRGVCAEAEKLVSRRHLGLSLQECGQNVYQLIMSSILSPIRAFQEASSCFQDLNKKREILGQGPWVSDWLELPEANLNRQLQNLSCAEVERLRQSRLQNYIRRHRLTAEQLMERVTDDASMSPRERLRVARDIESTSPEKMLQRASDIWASLSQGMERMSCYKIEVQGGALCSGGVQLASIPLSASAGSRLRELTGNSRILQRLNPSPRDLFVNRWIRSYSTSEAENLRWMARADRAPRSGEQVRFLDVENSQLKRLNETLNDYDAVTAINNRYHHLFRERMDEYLRRHPGLEIERYSDFKSMRFSFSGNLPENFDQDLQGIFREVNGRFSRELREQGIVRAGDTPETWFQGGLSANAEEANLAARYGRRTNSNGIWSSNDQQVRESLQRSYQETRRDLDGLREALGDHPALERITSARPGGGDVFVPSRELLEAIRRKDNPQEIIESVRRVYPDAPPLTSQQASRLRDYANRIDEFQPSLRIPSRTTPDLSDAVHGGVSGDFKGLGTYNLHATARALAESQDLSDATRLARRYEGDVTQELNQRRQGFSTTVQRATRNQVECSGDDCIGRAMRPLTDRDRQNIVRDLVASEGGALRVSFIRDGISRPQSRTQIAKHGEEIEKVLRARLGREIPNTTLNQILFGIDMNTRELGQGSVNLIIGRRSGVQLTEAQRQSIEREFREAVAEQNRRREGTRYRTGDLSF